MRKRASVAGSVIGSGAARAAVRVDPSAQAPRLQEGCRDHAVGQRPVGGQPEPVAVERQGVPVAQLGEGVQLCRHVVKLPGGASRFHQRG
jgi:hypothetical protein